MFFYVVEACIAYVVLYLAGVFISRVTVSAQGHVMDEQVVQLAPAQSMGHVFKKCAGYGLIHCVEKNGLFVQQKIGVVGNAFGNAVNALKTGKTPVVGADPC